MIKKFKWKNSLHEIYRGSMAKGYSYLKKIRLNDKKSTHVFHGAYLDENSTDEKSNIILKKYKNNQFHGIGFDLDNTEERFKQSWDDLKKELPEDIRTIEEVFNWLQTRKEIKIKL